MIWRWIIRGICLTLLGLCVLVWVASHLQWAQLEYDRWNHARSLFLAPGWIWYWDTSRTYDDQPFLRFDHSPVYRGSFSQLYLSTQHHVAGFAYDFNTATDLPNPSHRIFVPLWFTTLLSGLLLLFIWRKTRRKHSSRGFPVEAPVKQAFPAKISEPTPPTT